MGISVFEISSEREILEKNGLLHDADSNALSVEFTNGALDSFIMFRCNAQFREVECRNGLSVVQLLLIHSRDNHTHGRGIVRYRVDKDERACLLVEFVGIEEEFLRGLNHHAANFVEAESLTLALLKGVHVYAVKDSCSWSV